MSRLLHRLFAAGLGPLLAATTLAAPRDEPVVLLHGLARGPASMAPLARSLRAAGYPVCNVAYPSRRDAIAVLARDHVAPAIRACFPGYAGPLHFVTHSLGGLVVRELAATGQVRAARVVMLGPPNHGSEVVAVLGDQWWFRQGAGPAGQQLRPRPDDAGTPLPFELGVIAGNRSLNPVLSRWLPGPDDGKVTVASARLAGMRDFLVLPVSHPLLMRNREVQRQTLHFLAQGRFAPVGAPSGATPAAELATGAQAN